MSKYQNSVILGNGDNTVEILPRKSRLAKKIIIRISKRKGVELIVPTRVSLKKALDFLYTKESWVLQKNLELLNKSRINFAQFTKIPILGNNYIIKHSGNLRGISKIEDGHLIVSGLEEHIPRKTKQFLIKMAKEKITACANIEAKKLGVRFNRITVRDTTSRWGSCSRSGRISFSWRLVIKSCSKN